MTVKTLSEMQDDTDKAFNAALDSLKRVRQTIDDATLAPPRRSGPPSMEQCTMLDWFAGQALSGMMGNPNTDLLSPDAADVCYTFAQAMLDERAKRMGS